MATMSLQDGHQFLPLLYTFVSPPTKRWILFSFYLNLDWPCDSLDQQMLQKWLCSCSEPSSEEAQRP